MLGCVKNETPSAIDPGVIWLKKGDIIVRGDEKIPVPWDGVALRTDVHEKAVIGN